MSKSSLLPLETITHRILLLREQKVLLDADLAALYGVETKVLLQAVKRNLERFPDDFMFQLTNQEFNVLRSQSVTSSSEALETLRWGGRRTAPYAFTEQGVAMLSSVLGSPQAVQVNIAIMRAFVKLRELAMTHHDLAKQLDALEEKTDMMALQHDQFARNTRAQLKQVFDAIRELMTPPETQKKRPIGFITGEEKPKKDG
ncbi:MAG: ORF6N domain-containing protein [Nitrosomonadales bacterium]|nr:ORF6N domain-containing protein [Nitrosomonadales bacterium]